MWFAPLWVAAQTVEMAPVKSQSVSRQLRLPAELTAYERVDLTARVGGYVERVLVDRGAFVKRGQVLVELSAPEMAAQIAEAQARAASQKSQQAEAEAREAAAAATLERMAKAAKTPGAVAGNELVLAEKQRDAARSSVASARESVRAAEAHVRALQELQSYLKVTAPFEGQVIERMAHPGMLAGPAAGPLLRLENVARLRLTVAVPENEAGRIPRGARLTFAVPAYPGQTFEGVVARVPQSLDAKTRTLPAELEVANGGGRLAPGMYAEVVWPSNQADVLLVPATAVVTTTERVFVIRAHQGKAEWIAVKKGPAHGDLVEVSGALRPGDAVVKRASDEIRPGQPLR
jgi:RND family efflux transporter MFP subunit